MKHHEYASLFPMLADGELQSLADDIAANGLQTPIVTLDGEILDGRNRHRACEIAGVEPTFEEYRGKDPLAFVISHNLHRRHLSESQRGMVAAKLATMKQGSRSDLAPIDAKSKADACEALNVGVSTLDRARKIQRIGSPELVSAVESGDIAVGAAYKVAELPHEEQAALVEKGPEAVKAKAREIRSTPTTPSVDRPARLPKFVPDDADRLWLIAQSHLDKILPSDSSRERVLREVVAYAEKRIADEK